MARPKDAAWIVQAWEEGNSRRQPVDNEIYQNFAFLYDEHYARYDTGVRTFVPPPQDGRVRMTIPLIKSLWRGELGTMLKARPIPEAVPGSDSDIDRNVARIANRMLTSELDRLRFESMRADLMTWVTAAGHAYLHPHWDPAANDSKIDLVTPGELVRDPAARMSVDEGQWVIHGRFLTVEESEEKFGRTFASATNNDRMLNLAHLVGGWQAGGLNTTVEGVLVLRLWHKPCRAYPTGLILTAVGSEEVERIEDYPWEEMDNELPFIDFHHIRLPGRFEGQASIRSAWGAQRNFNHSVSKQAEARNLLATPRIMGVKGSFDHERLSLDPGEWWQYNQVGMHEPKVVQFPSPANYLFEEQESAYRQMQELFHRREVSRGQVPTSGLASTAIAQLKEADDTALAPITSGMEQGIASLGRHLLRLCKFYWTTQRAVTVWSEETNSHIVEQWAGADLKGNYDVRVTPGSALPRDADQQRQDIIALAEMKIVTDPRLIIKHMQLPNGEGIMRELDEFGRQAKREHDRIFKRWSPDEMGRVPAQELDEMGQPASVPVQADLKHNHDVHMAEHERQMATEDFESWPDGAKAELNDHWYEHKALRTQKMTEQAQEQAMLQMAAQPPMPPQGGMPPGPQDGSPNALPGVNTPEAPPEEPLLPEAV